MHRCLITPADWDSHRIELPRDEAHHLRHVLRVGDGAAVRVCDGRGREAEATVALEGTDTVILHLLDTIQSLSPGVTLSLIQAVPKGSRMDLIIEKGTELGVTRFLPVATARGIVKGDKHDRWQRIAISAARQCGVGWIPEIDAVAPLVEALVSRAEDDLFLVASLESDAQDLQTVLSAARDRNVTAVTVLIGPEGDLTTEEYALAREQGAIPVSLGPLVLRVETAALYVAATVGYELRRG
jgi:16S rRNA (uracil1498-N3)-methyltransferase